MPEKQYIAFRGILASRYDWTGRPVVSSTELPVGKRFSMLDNNLARISGLINVVKLAEKIGRSLWEYRKTFLVVLLTAASIPSFAASGRTVEVGIPTTQFNFVSATQLQREWCWAASVQMVLNWYNIPVKQSEVVKRIYGNTKDEAASENAITVALTGNATDRKGRPLHLRAERRTGIPSAKMLVAELQSRHPLLITIHTSRNMLHAVVLTSAQYENTANGLRVVSLTYRDPNPTFQDRRSAGAIRVSGAKLGRFIRSISSYYLVSVQS